METGRQILKTQFGFLLFHTKMKGAEQRVSTGEVEVSAQSAHEYHREPSTLQGRAGAVRSSLRPLGQKSDMLIFLNSLPMRNFLDLYCCRNGDLWRFIATRR